jgi:hypothetical protein
MSLKKTETSFVFDPDIDAKADEFGVKLSKSEKKELLNEIGDYLVTEILSYIGDTNSPVSGYGEFKKLSKTYADREKLGDRTPILELNGDMLEALTFNIVDGSLKIGIFDEDQAIKSFNHNTGDTVPMRRFIPGKDEKLKKGITSYVDTIIEDYLSDKGQD